MNLPPLTQAFVLHFGEMGSRWGISRTVGQIYALLFLAEDPLNADDITETRLPTDEELRLIRTEIDPKGQRGYEVKN